MKTYQLNAEARTDLGKKGRIRPSARRTRIPVVLNGGKLVDLDKDGNYSGKLLAGEKVIPVGRDGKGIITTDLVVNFADVRKLIYSTDVYVIELTYDGQTRKAVLKDLQFHPVSDAVLHMDLMEVSEDKPVVVEIPVHLEGHAVGVKAGGKLYLSMKKVKVKGLYKDIPETIMLNVDKLEIGKAIKVRDCQFDNIELVSAKSLLSSWCPPPVTLLPPPLLRMARLLRARLPSNVTYHRSANSAA